MTEHKCDKCFYEFATCTAKGVVFGIDQDPEARGAEADRVLECGSFVPTARDKKAIREQGRSAT